MVASISSDHAALDVAEEVPNSATGGGAPGQGGVDAKQDWKMALHVE
jgi:hypothetical protein